MSTFLLSWLSKQYGALDAQVFLREQPGSWLVLENEAGSPTRAANPIAMRVALRRDRTLFTVGRDPSSDFVVTDPGVALAHAILQPEEDGGWSIRRASAESPALLDGLELGDTPIALGSGARIDLGGARFTYYSGEDLHARMKDVA